MNNFGSNQQMFASTLSVNALRPYIDKDGSSKVLATNGAALVTNAPATLRYDEWKDIDTRVIQVTIDRLTGLADLMAKGLTHPLGSIGATLSQWQRQSNMSGATVSMSGITRGENDGTEFDTKKVPVPVVHKDFRLNVRYLEASRRNGAGLDLSMVDTASRVVAERSEDMLFAGEAITVDGDTIYGYTTHPDRNTVSLAMQWTNVSKTGALILADVQGMLVAARADKMFGPFTLYIPAGYQGKLDDDFAPGTSDNRTIRQRIMQLEGIAEIKVADRLAAHNVVMAQMTSDVVDLAIAQDVTPVQWEQQGGLEQLFKVMAVWVPRVKSTFDGQSGIVHLS